MKIETQNLTIGPGELGLILYNAGADTDVDGVAVRDFGYEVANHSSSTTLTVVGQNSNSGVAFQSAYSIDVAPRSTLCVGTDALWYYHRLEVLNPSESEVVSVTITRSSRS